MVPSRASTVVRAPNHLGDVVLALPALQSGNHDVMVVRPLVPVLEMAGLAGEILPLDRGTSGFLHAAKRLRARGYQKGILFPPSFSSAMVFSAGGVRSIRGTDTDGRWLLLQDPVATSEIIGAGLHRSEQYWRLVHKAAPAGPLVPALTIPSAARASWDDIAGGGAARGALGIFPGSNAPSRRWPTVRFAELTRRLTAHGQRVVVFGGPAERTTTAEIAAAGGANALDLGGRTDLPTLAAGLASCALLVSNDSGPLHLAAAVGTRTISLWGAGDPVVTGPLGTGNRIIRRADLPCVPCVKNECPRSGAGYVIQWANTECLHLIGVDEVEAAAIAALEATTTTSQD
jgi:heptosyltransferase-2